MKKNNILIFTLLITSIAFSQTLYVPSGTNGITNSPNSNIGVGVGSIWPDKKFTVLGDVRLGMEGIGGGFQRNGILIQSNGTRTELRWQHFGQLTNPYIAVDPGVDATRLLFGTNGNDVMAIRHNGNVGIGTISPVNILDVRLASSFGYTARFAEVNGVGIILGVNPNNNDPLSGYIGHTSSNRNINYGVSGIGKHIFNTNDGQSLIIHSSGSVGIGTSTTGNHKLAVGGSIGAREIRVETGSWSDFVFEADYKLRSLEEIERFITENKHLPEIPSKSEVMENGINLGEMDSKLLQKIEELTLYLIEQNKKIEELQKEVFASKNE